MSDRILRARDYLGHMLDAARQIQSYTDGKTQVDFRAARLLQDAVIRNLEILGEASRKLLESAPDVATRFSSIPFTAIYAMRNQLSHGYFSVDLEIVWRVIEHDLPELRGQLEFAIQEMDK